MYRKALSIMAVFVAILLGFAALAGRRVSVNTVVPNPRPAQEYQQSGSRVFQIVTLSHRQRPDPPVEGGCPRPGYGNPVVPAQLPGVLHALATNGLIGINSDL